MVDTVLDTVCAFVHCNRDNLYIYFLTSVVLALSTRFYFYYRRPIVKEMDVPTPWAWVRAGIDICSERSGSLQPNLPVQVL
jgi:hypothetical protein